jgi:hypothetical protein
MELEKLKNELAEAQAAEDAKREAENAEAQRLAELQAAVDAEEKRLNSKEYKAALRAIDEMAVEAEARKQTVHELVDSIVAEIEEWENVINQRKALARENRIDAKDLKMAEMGIGGNVYQLREAVREWKKRIKLFEALKGMNKPVQKKR